jgi:hypothetical protein
MKWLKIGSDSNFRHLSSALKGHRRIERRLLSNGKVALLRNVLPPFY